jgi:integrase
MRAEDLRRSDVLKYRNNRKTAGAANATINREVSVLLAVLGFAEAEEWLEVNPLPRRRIKPLPETERTDYFEPEEWERFRHAFDSEKAWEAHRRKVRNLGPVLVIPDAGRRIVKTKRGPRRVTRERRYGGGRLPDSDASHAYRERLRRAVDVFEFLLRTGSRISEALALTWDAVDLERAAIRIYQPKVKAWKEQPIPDELRAVLKRQTRGTGKAPVFQRPSGGPWDSSKLQRAFRVARSISEVNPRLTIHSLRHSAASWLTIAGVPERHVRDILGQKDPRSTRRYSHLRPEHLGGALDVLSKAAGTVEKPRTVTRRVTRGK